MDKTPSGEMLCCLKNKMHQWEESVISSVRDCITFPRYCKSKGKNVFIIEVYFL